MTHSSSSSAQTCLTRDLLPVPVGVGGREWSMDSAERPFVLKGSHILCLSHLQADRLTHTGNTLVPMFTDNDDRDIQHTQLNINDHVLP